MATDLRSRYEEAVRDNGYEGSYDDFIQDLWEMENEMKSSSLRNGGRIGFQDGKTLDFEVYKFYFMNALGMDEDQAEKATEQELYGPDSAKLRDSKKGIGSMMASMDNDSAPNAEVIEPRFDAGGQEELLREIETQGGLRTASAQDEMADAYALYDSAVEQGFQGSFEEFIQLMMIEANKGQSMKGAEGLASLVA